MTAGRTNKDFKINDYFSTGRFSIPNRPVHRNYLAPLHL